MDETFIKHPGKQKDPTDAEEQEIALADAEVEKVVTFEALLEVLNRVDYALTSTGRRAPTKPMAELLGALADSLQWDEIKPDVDLGQIENSLRILGVTAVVRKKAIEFFRKKLEGLKSE